MWRIKEFFENLYYSIKYGIPNLIYYLKVIWEDRDFDHSYIEKILLMKYKKQYKRLNEKDRFVDSKKYNKALKLCITILDRRQSCWYDDTYFYLIDTDLKFIPVPKDLEKNLGEDYEEDSSMLDPNWDISSNMSLYNKKSEEARLVEERDWKLYCKLVEMYHRNWWD